MLKYYNLNVGWNPGFIDKPNLLYSLGWHGVCFTERFSPGFNRFSGKVLRLREDLGVEVFIGAVVSKPVRKNARKALDEADLILVEDVSREASECWEVDVVSSPEQISERDYMKQRGSGIDHITARFMAEKCIAMELNFSDLLSSHGRQRAVICGRMRQNIMLARRYNVPVVMSTGSGDIYDLRSPLELISVGIKLGMTREEARDAVTVNPLRIMQKSMDRRNPDVLLKGLEVMDWGRIKKPDKKRMYGWY